MTPLSALLRDLMGKILALRVMRAHVAAPDPTVPLCDADRHSRKIYVYRTRFLRVADGDRLDLSVVASSPSEAAEIIATAPEFR